MTARGGRALTIATLIAAGRLEETLVAAAIDRLAAQGLGARPAGWVDRGNAADLEIDAAPGRIRDALAGWEAVDLLPRTAGPPLRRLFVADMDSTMIGQECIDELAAYAGVGEQVADITERAMRGDLDFAGALAARVGLLKGLDASVIDRCVAERIRPNPGAATLVATLAANGVETVLVTGGFTAFAHPIGTSLGFARIEANVLQIAAGKLTGHTIGPVVDSARKRAVLEETRLELDLPPEATLAIGDGANDRLMIEAAGLGCGYRPKPALAAVADAIILNHGLDALLWAQGIPRSRWVERD